MGKHLKQQVLVMTTLSQKTSLSMRTEKELKDSFEVIDELELAVLVDVELETVRQWRSRRIGPKYFNAGNARLYFKKDVIDWFTTDRDRNEMNTFDRKVMV
jgi:hypothetical protein